MEEKLEFYNFFHQESLKNLTELCELPEELSKNLIESLPQFDLKERVKLFLMLGQYYLQKLEKEKDGA